MKRSLIAALIATTFGSVAATANAAVIFVDLGTAAPPATLGGYAMTAFPDTAGEFTSVTSVASPLGGSVLFSVALEKRDVTPGLGWSTWSHGYTGDVYADFSSPYGVTLTLPSGTGAFYFYAEPNEFRSFDFRVTDQTGAVYDDTITGLSGAEGFGFYGTSGSLITTISVTAERSSGGFAIGEFGIASAPVPLPGSLALLGLGLAGLGLTRRRTA